jgi:hypothetical protein
VIDEDLERIVTLKAHRSRTSLDELDLGDSQDQRRSSGCHRPPVRPLPRCERQPQPRRR